MLGKLEHAGVIKGADHDQVDIARQHLGGVGNGLGTAQLHFCSRQEQGLAAELTHADIK